MWQTPCVIREVIRGEFAKTNTPFFAYRVEHVDGRGWTVYEWQIERRNKPLGGA